MIQQDELSLNQFTPLPEFESSNIASMAYNAAVQQLLVEFKQGQRYIYFEVGQSIVDRLINAIDDENLSVGKTFNAYVKKGDFEYMKLDAVMVEEEEEDIQAQVQERILSGIDMGMLWFDNNPKSSLLDKIDRAIDYYCDKYNVPFGHHLDVVISDKDNQSGESIYAYGEGVTIMAASYILPHHFLIGKAHK